MLETRFLGAATSPGVLPGLLPAALYALLFAPLYTLLGWFEAMPLFFMLLGLDLLLMPPRLGMGWQRHCRRAGFSGQAHTHFARTDCGALAGGEAELACSARDEWFNRRAPGNLLRPALYVLIFAVVTLGVGLLALGPGFDPQLALSSFRINAIRPPWQSIWALLDGYYGYGLVPIDMRNLQGLAAGDQWQTRLPWGLIGMAFVAVYLWIYTRRYDWTGARGRQIVLTAVSVIWLFLYSKGWSPQFVVWILALLVLLTPSMQGVVLAIALTAINFVESTVFLLVLPQEHWLLVATVLARTLLLVLLAAEWLGQIWPAATVGRRMQLLAARLAWIVVAAALATAVAGAPAQHRRTGNGARLSTRAVKPSRSCAGMPTLPNRPSSPPRSACGATSTRGCTMSTPSMSWMAMIPTTGPQRPSWATSWHSSPA